MNERCLVIWDLDDVPKKSHIKSVIVFWNNSSIINDDVYLSISKIIEENDDLVKDEFLKWVNRLAENPSINGYFSTRSNYSLWKSSVLLSKQVMSRTYNVEILKLIALDIYVKKHKISTIDIRSDNFKLNVILSEYCAENNIGLINSNTKKYREKSKGSYFKKLIYSLAWISRFYFNSLNLKISRRKVLQNHGAEITIFTFFDKGALDKSKKNKYWLGLNEFLERNGISSNWIHLSSINDTAVKSKRVEQKFESDYYTSSKNEQHLLLNDFVSIWIILKTLYMWVHLVYKYFRNRKIIVIPKIRGFNVKTLISDDIQNSLIGSYSVSNILYLNLIEKVLKFLPMQKLCLYPLENQSWEYSLLFNWKKLFGSNIIGNAHSSVRPWDLRYFNCRDYFENNSDHSFPDVIAVNSRSVKKNLISFGTPADKIVEVEALRYNYILDIDIFFDSIRDKETLILGDYSESITIELLDMVYEAFKFEYDHRFSIKFHPECIVDLSKYTDIDLNVIDTPVSEIINHYEMCISSESTTAAIEFWQKNKKVISCVNGINFSPLLGCRNICFVYNKTELYNSVINHFEEPTFNRGNNYFILDKKIPAWAETIEKYLQ